jgi:ADP-heptose:LPS heptosyltransferase
MIKKSIRLFMKFTGFLFPPSPIADKPEKILLLMCHWIGDTFWAMQIIPAVKKQYPDAEIFVGIKSFSKDLFYNLIPDTNIIILDCVVSDRKREKFSIRTYMKEVRQLKNHHFQLGIDLTGNRYSALFLYLAKIPSVGLDINELSSIYSLKGGAFPDNRHLRHRPWDTLKTITKIKIPIPVFLTPILPAVTFQELSRNLKIPSDKPVVMLIPGAGWEEKQWSPDSFAACGKYLEDSGAIVILSGSSKEEQLCRKIGESLINPIIIINNLQYTISLIPHLKFALTNDSGIAHLIAAENINLAAIYLVTDPDRCGPIGKNVTILTVSNVSVKHVKTLVNNVQISTNI